MQKLCVLSPLVIVPLVSISCGRSPEPTAPEAQAAKPSTSARARLVRFPDGWRREDDKDGFAVWGFPTPDRRVGSFVANVNVKIMDNPARLPLVGFCNEQFNLDTAKSLFKDFQVLSTTEQRLGTRPARRILFTHRHQNGIPLKVLIYATVDDTKGYVITCTAEDTDFDTYLSQFEAICRSFEPESGAAERVQEK